MCPWQVTVRSPLSQQTPAWVDLSISERRVGAMEGSQYGLVMTWQGRIPPILRKYRCFISFFRLLPKISPNLGYIFTPRPSYFKVLDPPLHDIECIHVVMRKAFLQWGKHGVNRIIQTLLIFLSHMNFSSDLQSSTLLTTYLKFGLDKCITTYECSSVVRIAVRRVFLATFTFLLRYSAVFCTSSRVVWDWWWYHPPDHHRCHNICLRLPTKPVGWWHISST
jgi:hypothetical protein